MEDKGSDIPERLIDTKTRTNYKRMRFYGKGGFAKYYEIINVVTNDVYAAKIVSKKLMLKYNQLETKGQEITIHKSLHHPNIVKFCSFFEDYQNVYIVLELCNKRSMMELHKRRKAITDYECRYYMYQIIQGVKYLHDNNIIHRDLKLGNLFLNDSMQVNIGDFGLATRIEYEGERKKSFCGTPNYVAPEVLTKKGYSFEVDIWSIGCVMYTLLVGQPPFETKTLKDTYNKIKKCEYRVPSYMRKPAADMVIATLQPNPEARPNITDLLSFDFFTAQPVPTFLPSSCLTMAPRVDLNDQVCHPAMDANMQRRPLSELNTVKDDTRLESTFLKNNLHDAITASAQFTRHNEDYRADIESLHQQLTSLLNSKFKILRNHLGDEFTDPAAQPLYWITKWVDYSDKYGFGYQLCDEGIGVMFNDTTKLILLPNGINVHLIDKDGKETYMTVTDYLTPLKYKMKLLTYFKRYMTEDLVKAGANNVNFKDDSLSRMPHLHSWFRTTCAVVMHLTNGSVQFNFNDHIKIVLCPRMSSITYVDNQNYFRTYRFSTIVQHGCAKDLYEKIRYAHEKIRKMLEKKLF